MSQLEYYGRDPNAALPHASGLRAWGVALIVLGALAALMGVLVAVVAAAMATKVLPGTEAQNPGLVLIGAGVYMIAGTVLILIGVGSCRGRRWVRPMIIVATTLTAGAGLMTVVSLGLGIFQYSQHPVARPAGTAGMPFDPTLIGFASGACFAVMLMLVVPGVLLWFYGRSSVQATLDALDPVPRWTDRVPLPVLGWSIACVLAGLGLASSAVQGIFPCFTLVMYGGAAYVTIGALAAMLIVGGVLCYVKNGFGPLISLAAMALLAASFTTFAFLGDHQAYLDYLFQKIPAAQRGVAEQFAGNSLGGPALMYSAAVIYAVVIRKQFGRGSSPPTFSV